MKVLFILKKKSDYALSEKINDATGLTTGLYNSSGFVNDLLVSAGIDSKMVVVIDNNDIDRVVHQNRPSHVIIEALWVTPSKFAVLTKLHPNVTWIIRLHSEMPFIANEGMAMDWLGDYLPYKNVVIGVNSPRMYEEIRTYFRWIRPDIDVDKRVAYLPNYYPNKFEDKHFDCYKDTIDIGCFGAIRPLKNQLIQAFAAVQFAESLGKRLNFHINVNRVEMKGGPVLNNLMGFFQHIYYRGHRLVGHEWLERDEFLKLCAQMDMGMQVSMSETFNIVAADVISQGVPIVISREIPWSNCLFSANPTSSDSIANTLRFSYKYSKLNVFLHQRSLKKYISRSARQWIEYFRKPECQPIPLIP